MAEEAKQKIKEKTRLWFKDNYNLLLFAILSFSVVIRLYFLFLTRNQPLWWDEADYMAFAKNLAGFSANWVIIPHHNTLFSYIAAPFLKTGIPEVFIKFFLEVIPSILLVFLTYGICMMMYDNRKIALSASFLMAVFWDGLFNSMRFHVDIPALFFAFLAIYVFWQGYERKNKIFNLINSNWAITLTVVFLLISYSIRRGYFLFGIFFLLYVFLTRPFKELIKDKYNWIALIFAIAIFLLIERFIFISSVAQVAEIYHGASRNPFNWYPFYMFAAFFNTEKNSIFSILTYLFWIGFPILIFNLFLFCDSFIKKNFNFKTKADLFNFLSIIITLSFFLFYSRSLDFGEPRWYFSMLLGSFICVIKAANFITGFIGKYSKQIAIIVFIFIFCFGGYYQVAHANSAIKSRVNSYDGIKQAGLFIKEISDENDLIIVRPQPQTAYYSERKVAQPIVLVNFTGANSEDVPFEPVLEKIRETPEAKYIIITLTEPGHPYWMITRAQTTIKIPFMNSTIDIANANHDIKQSKSYGNLEFRLLSVFNGEAFVYEIIHH